MEYISLVYLLPKPFLQKKSRLAADMLLANTEEGSCFYEECSTSHYASFWAHTNACWLVMAWAKKRIKNNERKRESAVTKGRIDWPLQHIKASSASFKRLFSSCITDSDFHVALLLAILPIWLCIRPPTSCGLPDVWKVQDLSFNLEIEVHFCLLQFQRK